MLTVIIHDICLKSSHENAAFTVVKGIKLPIYFLISSKILKVTNVKVENVAFNHILFTISLR